MVHIFDNDIYDKLLKIEGPGFKWQLEQKANESTYSLQFALDLYRKRCLIPLTLEDDDPEEFYEWLFDKCIATIYGLSGWNRYFVYGNGQIKISRCLSKETAVEMAIELGFGVLG